MPGGGRTTTAGAGAGGLHGGEDLGSNDVTPGDAVLDALWLKTLQRICERAAHEMKGALNAVAVNLEVVRSRAARPDAPATALARYAEAATGQLESLIAMTGALLSLARAGGVPVDVGAEAARVVALLGPVARAVGRRVEEDASVRDAGTTSASAAATRLAIGGCVLAAMQASSDVRCVADPGESGPGLRVEARDSGALDLDADMVGALSAAGIAVRRKEGAESSAICISFPSMTEGTN